MLDTATSPAVYAGPCKVISVSRKPAKRDMRTLASRDSRCTLGVTICLSSAHINTVRVAHETWRLSIDSDQPRRMQFGGLVMPPGVANPRPTTSWMRLKTAAGPEECSLCEWCHQLSVQSCGCRVSHVPSGGCSTDAKLSWIRDIQQWCAAGGQMCSGRRTQGGVCD